MGFCIHFCCCCFNNLSSKASEIILISIHSVAIVLVECCFIIIVWKKISIANLIIFIFILLFNLICLIFVIIIRIWRAKNLIKSTYRNAGSIFSSSSLILSITCFILSIIEIILISIDFSDPIDICQNISSINNSNNNNDECQKNSITLKERLIAYITFIYLYIGLIFGIIIWALLRIKIKFQIDVSIPFDINKFGHGKKVTVLPLEDANIKINQYRPGYYFSYGENGSNNNQNINLSNNITGINYQSQISNNILNHSRNIP